MLDTGFRMLDAGWGTGRKRGAIRITAAAEPRVGHRVSSIEHPVSSIPHPA
jgi:hypothetical protein